MSNPVDTLVADDLPCPQGLHLLDHQRLALLEMVWAAMTDRMKAELGQRLEHPERYAQKPEVTGRGYYVVMICQDTCIQFSYKYAAKSLTEARRQAEQDHPDLVFLAGAEL